MARKQTEGDNPQRRHRAHQARREGASPSEAQVTTGASRQRQHLPHKAKTEERQRSPERGKQRSGVDEGPSRR